MLFPGQIPEEVPYMTLSSDELEMTAAGIVPVK
jgi:hypothetical protein